MKQILLPSLLLSAALGVSAATPAADLQVKSGTDAVKVKNVTNSGSATTARRLAPGVTITTNHGLKHLNIAPERTATNKITPRINHKATPLKENEQQPYVLFESFEGWDGETEDWLPEGWTVDRRGGVPLEDSWKPSLTSEEYGVAAPDGNYAYSIKYSIGQQDEWLITPQVEIQDNYSFSYSLYLDPLYLFRTDNVNWDTGEFVGGAKVAATLQIWAQPEGGEWTMLHDYADDYKNPNAFDLQKASTYRFERRSHNLDEFAGKKIKLAFRLVGSDGNVILIDAVSVGLPALEGVNYTDPIHTLYWGYERGTGLRGIQADIAMQPVYAPLTWANAYFDEADITWTYCDPATGELTTSDDPEELTVTYTPDYSSTATMKNNFFTPPTLTASAPGAASTSFTAPYALFQAGGKAERTLADDSEFTPALFPFGHNELGVYKLTVSDDALGAWALPVFGYDLHSNDYWLNYSLNGETPNPTDYARLEGIANVFCPSEAPLVVNGITVFGYGAMDADAELTASIYRFTDGIFDYGNMTPVASATIKGSDILSDSEDGSRDYICLPFNFSEPAVVQGDSDSSDMWVFLLTGFNSDKVEYFAPLQSFYEDRNYFSWGYMLKHIDLTSHGIRDSDYWNLAPLTYTYNGEYVDVYASFAIGIEGEYPWLTTDCDGDGIELGTEPVEVALGSYYDGSKLTVEAPAGVTATVAGRYNACKLTVTRSDAAVEAEGNITVKGPGVEVTIPVKAAAGIADITAEGAALVGLYDLNGRSISRENAATGIYVAKYSDGTARKVAIK